MTPTPEALPGWQSNARAELAQAEAARAAGFEGRARVCARRAAGHIAGEYLRRRGLPLRGLPFADPSAYSRLRYLQTLPGLSSAAQAAVALLITRLQPDFTLPQPADLLAEARRLAQELLGEDL
jgi:hypothetical protein